MATGRTEDRMKTRISVYQQPNGKLMVQTWGPPAKGKRSPQAIFDMGLDGREALASVARHLAEGQGWDVNDLLAETAKLVLLGD